MKIPKKVAYYFTPVLCLVFAGIQLILSNATTLSRWRGGGFGMYSETHFHRRIMWVYLKKFNIKLHWRAVEFELNEAKRYYRHDKKIIDSINNLLFVKNNVLGYPKSQNMRELIKSFKELPWKLKTENPDIPICLVFGQSIAAIGPLEIKIFIRKFNYKDKTMTKTLLTSFEE